MIVSLHNNRPIVALYINRSERSIGVMVVNSVLVVAIPVPPMMPATVASQ